MKVPLTWLKKHISIDNLPIDRLTKIFTSLGMEVEDVIGTSFDFEGVITVKIIEILPHENADHLQIAMVSDGQNTYHIVCGDKTIQVGDIVPLAKIGAVLFSSTSDPLVIRKAKIRGAPSEGMLCAKEELSLEEKSDHVWKMDPTTPIGVDLKTYLFNPIFDIALTPNLGHARSILGVARELNAVLQSGIHFHKITFEEKNISTSSKISLHKNVTKEDCTIYGVRVIEGVFVEPSPLWLQEALQSAGYTPVNNIVDILNYVMHDRGQPMHAFDYDKITKNTLHIDKIKKDVNVVTLDGKERTIPADTLVIQDDHGPVAIAGIMGLQNSMISSNTRSIILEAAVFHGSTIRASSKKMKLRSESSTRFENGVDPKGVEHALNQAASLIAEIAGGQVLKGIVFSEHITFKPRVITLRHEKVHAILGIELSVDEIEKILLSFEMNSVYENGIFQVRIPSYRNDVQYEIDLVEEIGRIYGYGNLPLKTPYFPSSPLPDDPFIVYENRLKQFLTRLGLQEMITCSLISPEMTPDSLEQGKFGNVSIPVLHAKSVDQSILRPSLLPGLLQALLVNQNQNETRILAFETGNVFFRFKDDYIEKPALAIILSGSKSQRHFQQQKPEPIDFYFLKGLVESLVQEFGSKEMTFHAEDYASFHPHQQLSLFYQEEMVGSFGKLHPIIVQKAGLIEEVYFAEFDLSTFFSVETECKKYTQLPQYPASERDFTFTMDRKKSLEKIFDKLHKHQSCNFYAFELLSIYEGENIDPSKKNVTLRFTYRNKERTLSENEIEEEHQTLTTLINRLKT